MFAVTAARLDPDEPLRGLQLGEHPDPTPGDGWTTVRVRATSLNHHDLWTLQGVGITQDELPIVLGCDAAGIDPDGNEVIVHSVIASPGWTGDETLDPRRSLLSERHDGTFAGIDPGATVLVQGAGGGVATALIVLGHAAGYRMWVTSRSAEKAERAVSLGADAAFESGARLPERADAVMETVGAATWAHSLKALRPGGTIVVSGATSGDAPAADLRRVFFLQLRVVGSTMGTRDELERLVRFCEVTGVRPLIDQVMPLTDAAEGFARLAAGEQFGKVVFTAG